MGSTFSSQSVEKENNTATKVLQDVLVEVSSSCKTITSTTQQMNDNRLSFDNINNSNISVELVQEIRSSLNASCIATQEIQTKLLDSYKEKLQSEVQQKTEGLSIGSDAEMNTINNTITEITSKIDMKSLTECIAQTSSNQEMFNNAVTFNNINSSTLNVSLRQYIVSSLVNHCIMSNTGFTAAAVDLDKQLSDLTLQSQKGFDFNKMISDYVNAISSVLKTGITTVGLSGIIFMGVAAIVLVFSPQVLCIIPGMQISPMCSKKGNNRRTIMKPMSIPHSYPPIRPPPIQQNQIK